MASPVMMTASFGSLTAKTSTMIRVRPPAVRITSLMIVQESRNPPSHRFTPTFPAQGLLLGLLPRVRCPVRSVYLIVSPVTAYDRTSREDTVSTARTDDNDHLGRFEMCAPARAGSATGAAVGLAVWALVSFVPAFHDGVPQPVVDVLPFALGWAGHTLAAWAAKHPEATGPVSPPQAPVITVPGASSPGPRGPMPAGEDGVPGAGHTGSAPSAA